jgi:hypothetical protein
MVLKVECMRAMILATYWSLCKEVCLLCVENTFYGCLRIADFYYYSMSCMFEPQDTIVLARKVKGRDKVCEIPERQRSHFLRLVLSHFLQDNNVYDRTRT